MSILFVICYTQIMKKDLAAYYREAVKNFGEAVINLFIFLPYFFSVGRLTKTLFFPWKNLTVKKTTAGFSFNDFLNRFSFNLISKAIGFIMRLSLISFYFFFQAVFMLALPFLAAGYFLLIPVFYLNYIYQKTDAEKKEMMKKDFIQKRMLKAENENIVSAWFEDYYQKHLGTIKWWALENLKLTPPLARDWAAGYTPNLDQYCVDLATAAYLHHMKNIVDREDEIEAIETILSKNIEANVIVVGEEGVGKHTIIDALAKKIYLGITRPQLMYKRILKLNMEKVPDNIFEDLLEEAAAAKNIILFIDNFEKYVDYADSFEEFAKSGNLQIIGVTSPFNYQKVVFTNEKLVRLFEKLDVYEVDRGKALKILMEASFNFEDYHKVLIPLETVREVVEKSEFYLTYIPFPEKAVDLLDLSAVYAKSKKMSVVTPEIVDQVLTQKTHVPTTVTSSMKQKLVNLEAELSTTIVQQEEAVKKLSAALRRSFLLIGKRKKPLATFLFLGPTGVGKTETAKAVAKVFFGEKYLIRFDMSLYQQKSDISRLIGDSRFGEPGLMSAAIRDNPYGVLLLDEIEKSNPDLLNIFLTIFDEGYFSDGGGRRVDCKNLVVIATSNAAGDLIYKGEQTKIIDLLVEQKLFSPEFLNRFDGIIVYEPLSRESIKVITRKMIAKIIKDVKELYKVNVFVTDATFDQLIDKGYDRKFGARNMERVIRDEIEDKISKILLRSQVNQGKAINL